MFPTSTETWEEDFKDFSNYEVLLSLAFQTVYAPDLAENEDVWGRLQFPPLKNPHSVFHVEIEEGHVTLKRALLDQSPVAFEPQKLHPAADQPPKCQGFSLSSQPYPHRSQSLPYELKIRSCSRITISTRGLANAHLLWKTAVLYVAAHFYIFLLLISEGGGYCPQKVPVPALCPRCPPACPCWAATPSAKHHAFAEPDFSPTECQELKGTTQGT